MTESVADSTRQRSSSLAPDGRRLKVRVGDLNGRFTRARRAVFAALIAVYAVVPWVRINGAPLVLLDILRRRFYLFGHTFNAQDANLLFFLLAGGLLSLIVVTALVGRVWCGWACPQTVFLEGVFRRIERLVEGPRYRQQRLEAGPWNGRKALLLGTKHALSLGVAFLVANVFISYFVSVESLLQWVTGDPRAHWTAFAWMAAVTGVMYFDFMWFREQTCLILCPYGRFQSAMTDDDTLVVGYDARRGEPRGRKGTAGAGDCVGCSRCVDVCPTGIDIREGLQLECIACANCIDACDDIMAKLGRPAGLVRYASLRSLAGGQARLLRPRVLVYAVLLLLIAGGGALAFGARHPFEANLIRQQGLPYTLEGGRVRNQYLVHVFNKTPAAADFELSVEAPAGASALVPVPLLHLESLADQRVPVVVDMPAAAYAGAPMVVLHTRERQDGSRVDSRLRFLGPE